ncbi:GRAS family transcription factor [Rhynchospora pubera]|uniref:GRAS family transcription factor n=1 Tax=Rhynchospora pubera TaxID=906938 RepID=A0AAV8GM69_9POAL|nr:GRAS family transcription factor [Rhynchospora pubera]KAJ4788224.1 GRAS family transcription factor [Rhynchospora pubera]KAJ4804521.1 GRAS family transcription factor [Rhynchospora pubera]
MAQDYNPQCSDCLCCSHPTVLIRNSPTVPEENNPNSYALNLTRFQTPSLSVSQQDCQTDSIYTSSSVSCVSEDLHDLKHTLLEIEKAMLGPDPDETANYPLADAGNKWMQMMEIVAGGLKQTLLACARAVADGDNDMTSLLMIELGQMVSVYGEPLQRLGAYMLEGLVARHASSGSFIYNSLKCKEPPPGSDLLSYMRIIYELCPYIKFAYLSANGTIMEAMRGENQIHIIDFQIAQGTQWMGLIQSLGALPGGPPHLKITGIDDPANAYARGGDLSIVGQRLSQIAESCKVPFDFHPVEVPACEVQIEHLGVKQGEAVAVNFILQLHHIPDESVDVVNHRDRILRMVKSLSPKVVTILEQESNTNTAPFFQRFAETLDYYNAMFESIDVTLPREHKDRTRVEQHCLAKEIVNVIACEGAERVERHEPFGKWRSRLGMAGFSPIPLSPTIHTSVRSLLLKYHRNYRCEERAGALFLGWKNRDLVVSSAWK